MTALVEHIDYQIRSTVRNPGQLVSTYLLPLGFYALMGLVMTKIDPLFKPTMIPAMTIFAAMTGGLLGLPAPLLQEREAGVYRAYRVNRVPASAILGVPAVTAVVHGLIAAAIIAVSAPVLFGAPAPTHWLALIACTVLGAMLFAGIGTLIGVSSPDQRTASLVSQAVFLPSMLLGGLMMPLSALPAEVRPVSMLLPTTWLAQLEQYAVYGRPTQLGPTLALVTLGATAVIAFALSGWLFEWNPGTGRSLKRLACLLAIVPMLTAMLIAR